MQKDFQNKYFNSFSDYLSPYTEDEPFKNGHCYCYVSDTLLNGIINYIKPIKAFLMDRYNEDLLSKNKALELFNSNSESHTNLSIFRDDVIMLAYEKESKFYWYLWFDMDCSDCVIGRFKTEDSEKQVIKSFEEWVKDTQKTFCDDYHPERKGEAIELNIKYINGWVRFQYLTFIFSNYIIMK